ncbi:MULTISPECIES: toxin-antitoxin system HicB family antitoxin [Rhodococcus]|uniref:toxin-antitoxin system HicB family antitoxin n=1 Tax=Rhodococcus TaxID=1827 RepID=UPI001E572670|nr:MULTISPECIES: toxin-antitoxin system HicB family antitoxin [Rhodococcus]MCD2108591.1 toxin-antitoxin system HicB family antitoxin [Rhodococcus qingshengii]MCZ4527484.1 toxin-antitoxin system HicB family antitoxin [Rhodococcus erythropolis]MDV8008235.1 toxin-antitoxin system HicB family antitoxin [Rhodococcus sp. IEGM 1318]
MDISEYTAKLQNDLVTAAELGDDHTRRIAASLSAAIEPSVRLVLLAAATELAKEIGAKLGDREVKVNLDGSELLVDVVRPPSSTGGDSADNEKADDEKKDSTYSFDDVSGDISRVTLRMMEQIKARAEEAANQNGVSLNSWVSQAVQGALRDQMRKNGMD